MYFPAAAVTVRSSLKSDLGCKFVVLYAYHLDTVYFVKKDVRVRGYLAKPQGCPLAKHWETLRYRIIVVLHQPETHHIR